MDESSKPLFVARAGVSAGGRMELRPLNAPHLPPDTADVPVLLRCYEKDDKQAVHIKGDLFPGDGGLWVVRNAEVTAKDNERTCFRQATDVAGEVTSLRQWGGGTIPCRLTNISIGGIGLWTENEFLPGERLLVSSEQFEQWKLKPMICVVRRVSRRRFGYEYGCEFAAMTPQLEEQITRIIMELQRQDKFKNGNR